MSETRETMDGLVCAHGQPEHDDAVLYLHSVCHPSDPTWASYEKATGDLTISCAVCEKPIATIAVVNGAKT